MSHETIGDGLCTIFDSGIAAECCDRHRSRYARSRTHRRTQRRHGDPPSPGTTWRSPPPAPIRIFGAGLLTAEPFAVPLQLENERSRRKKAIPLEATQAEPGSDGSLEDGQNRWKFSEPMGMPEPLPQPEISTVRAITQIAAFTGLRPFDPLPKGR